MRNDIEKKISYYLRLAELCSLGEDDKKCKYMAEVEKLLNFENSLSEKVRTPKKRYRPLQQSLKQKIDNVLTVPDYSNYLTPKGQELVYGIVIYPSETWVELWLEHLGLPNTDQNYYGVKKYICDMLNENEDLFYKIDKFSQL